MDEWTLNDLLECSVCLERLDTSSKVLPCQHTFCRPCLDEIITRQKELRCPECRVVVHASVDDLPPNVLLMRILEGIKNSGDKIHSGEKKKASSNSQKQEEASNSTEPTASQNDDNKDQKPAVVPTVPYAIAMYDYTSREAGDLHFSKGSIIFLLRKVDEHWYQGEFNGSIGIFPLNYVQVMRPLPPQQPACKALYDFRMPNDDDEGCLAFKKNDVISVIRKVDENWGEGKLNDRIGIFPLAFVEMNQAAECLMQNFRNPPPSESSRNLPPTPNPETCVPEAVSSSVNNRNNIAKLSKMPMNGFVGKVEVRPVSPVPSKLTNFLTLSSSSSATGTSSSSSTSNSAPNSPPSCQPPNSSNPFLPQSPRLRMLQSLLSKPTHGVLPTSHIADSQPSTCRQEVVNSPQSGDLSALSQPKGKRHSFSSPSSTSQNDSNRHQGEKVEKGNEGLESSNVNGRVSRPGSQRHRRSESDYVVTTGDPDNFRYIALYSYKPQKADELELQKGNMYYVLEVCQDGWFKGTSVKTQQTGVFPGNYVALVKKLPIILPPPTQPSPPPCHPRSSSSQTKPTKNQILQAQAMQLHYQLLDELENQSLQMMPPELPPRVSSPSSRQRSSFLSPAWNAKLEQNLASLRSSLFAELSSTGYTSEAQSQRGGVAIVAPCTTSGVSSNTSAKSTEATKDKKEKSGGLIKRLTTIKRSKSPPASSSSYSMDNPVFDESPALGLMSFRSHLAAQAQQSLHARSGSCPSQLIHVPESGTNHRILSASVSARMKHKERPSVSSASFTHSTSRDSDPIGAVYPTQSSHRKSNSLDAEESRKPKQLVPPIRERFRCIVPYPPNSDYELELRVGDIIYVHKKRDDGWYKGTQQRTGRTGLFPGSFVESY